MVQSIRDNVKFLIAPFAITSVIPQHVISAPSSVQVLVIRLSQLAIRVREVIEKIVPLQKEWYKVKCLGKKAKKNYNCIGYTNKWSEIKAVRAHNRYFQFKHMDELKLV
jgi:hypothetical protein